VAKPRLVLRKKKYGVATIAHARVIWRQLPRSLAIRVSTSDRHHQGGGRWVIVVTQEESRDSNGVASARAFNGQLDRCKERAPCCLSTARGSRTTGRTES
jgi:hypothetical protein